MHTCFIWKSNTDPQWAFKLNNAPAMEKMWGFKSLMPKVKHPDNLTCLPHLLKNYSNSDSTYSWRTANCVLYFAHVLNRKTVHFHLSTKACFLVWHPRIFLLITNLTHCFQCIYFTSLHVSSNPGLIIRRINCINTSSGIYHSSRWLSGMPVLTGIPDSHLLEWYIPDDVLIQLILLMMRTGFLETCREVK
jgi:hypothetical protein